ncbi:MAG: phosphatidylglycerophosphatase A [Betaproteobacteria bacterium]|nr:phosphatidylglycerophosphatase A [Betaproteobacteria bacterium]
MMSNVQHTTQISAPDWHFVLRHPAHFLAFGFGSGLSPVAPGTAGTLVAIPLYYALVVWLPMPLMYAVLIAALVVGVWACDVTGRALGEVDYGGIVWDEIAAFFLVLAVTPARPLWVLLAFVLFRLFDIWKPWPISWVDSRCKNAMGVMLDDVLAAVFTVLVIFSIQKWWS